MYLASFGNTRDNNFNLLRIIAALSVLVTHSYSLALGSEQAEPLRALIGMTPGSIAVDIFFIVSGFLVTASLLKSQNITDYVWARALRILPGLWVMLLATVFMLGPALTNISLNQYFGARQTYLYFAKCATLVTGVAYELPGMFGNNPYKLAVNGSLWTMPLEVRMYAFLAGAWCALAVIKKYRRTTLKCLVVASATLSYSLIIYFRLAGHEEIMFLRLFFMFFAGASVFFMQTFKLSFITFGLTLGCMIASAIWHQTIFRVVYTGGLAYIVFYLAYIPRGRLLRSYNRLGDYSYGVYIYAFPVQQAIASISPGVSVTGMLANSFVVTIILAILSWHFIEHPALKLKQNIPWLARQRAGSVPIQ